MHFNARYEYGDGDCDLCGGYEWYQFIVNDPDGALFYREGGDTHLSGTHCFFDMDLIKIKNIFEIFGHTVDVHFQNVKS